MNISATTKFRVGFSRKRYTLAIDKSIIVSLKGKKPLENHKVSKIRQRDTKKGTNKNNQC